MISKNGANLRVCTIFLLFHILKLASKKEAEYEKRHIRAIWLDIDCRNIFCGRDTYCCFFAGYNDYCVTHDTIVDFLLINYEIGGGNNESSGLSAFQILGRYFEKNL